MIKINPTYDQLYYIVKKFNLVPCYNGANSEHYQNYDHCYFYTCTRSPQGHTVTHINEELANVIKQDKLISNLIK